MPITIPSGGTKTATLATTLLRVEDSAGLPKTGEWLVVEWPSASQSSSNLVRYRLGSGADGDAVATDDGTKSPGTANEAWIPIGGAGSVCIAGSSAFAVTVRVV